MTPSFVNNNVVDQFYFEKASISVQDGTLVIDTRANDKEVFYRNVHISLSLDNTIIHVSAVRHFFKYSNYAFPATLPNPMDIIPEDRVIKKDWWKKQISVTVKEGYVECIKTEKATFLTNKYIIRS